MRLTCADFHFRILNAAARHLRTILSLILTNSEARKLLSDLSVIGRDLLALSAAKVAEVARPDEEKLARVDDSAPHDQFITEEGSTVGPHETPTGQQAYKEGSEHVQRLAEQATNGVQNAVSDAEKKPGLMDKVRGLKVTFFVIIATSRSRMPRSGQYRRHDSPTAE